MGELSTQSLALATIGLGGMLGISGVLTAVVISLMMGIETFRKQDNTT